MTKRVCDAIGNGNEDDGEGICFNETDPSRANGACDIDDEDEGEGAI